jgi:hypothetical protein
VGAVHTYNVGQTKTVTMKIRLYKDETVALRLDEIVSNLNRLAPRFSFALGQARFSVADDVIVCPETYRALDHRISEESAGDREIILFTEKPYDNNYFWDSDGNKIIVSLFAWDHLTALSRNNGAVYFICALLVRSLEVGHSHRRRTPAASTTSGATRLALIRVCVLLTCARVV